MGGRKSLGPFVKAFKVYEASSALIVIYPSICHCVEVMKWLYSLRLLCQPRTMQDMKTDHNVIQC